MQYLAPLLLAITALVTVTFGRPSSPIPDAPDSTDFPTTILISDAQFEDWLATTDAKLTFIGERPIFNPLAPRAAQNTKVTYCTKRSGNTCTGECTVYNGGAACIEAPDTECIAATQDVGFCSKTGCDGTCSSLSLCGTFLENGFCLTPETKSIVVSPL